MKQLKKFKAYDIKTDKTYILEYFSLKQAYYYNPQFKRIEEI